MAPPGSEHRAFVRVEGRGSRLPEASIVRSHFEQYGSIVDVYIPQSKPDSAYVSFTSPDELEAALYVNPSAVGGLVCTVERALPRGSPPNGALGSSAPAPSVDRVYVAGIVEAVTEEVLRNYFAHFGMVNDVYMPFDRQTGVKKPFAFVTMSTQEEVSSILAVPSHYTEDGHTMNCTPAAARGDKGAGKGPSYAEPGYHAHHGPPQHHYAAPAHQVHHPSAISYAANPANGHKGGYKGGHNRPALSLHQPAPHPAAHQGAAGPVQGVPGDHRLFVFGMPEGLNGDILRGHFARHAEIHDIYVPANKDIAYVTFSSEAELQEALMSSGLRIGGFWVEGMKRAESRGGKGKGKGKSDHRARPF